MRPRTAKSLAPSGICASRAVAQREAPSGRSGAAGTLAWTGGTYAHATTKLPAGGRSPTLNLCVAKCVYRFLDATVTPVHATQISALETSERLERYVRARGLKKGFVIKQALLHHLQALNELPEDAMIPPRLVVASESGERLLERFANEEAPNQALRELFAEELESQSDASS